jgi:hypothetical protein
MFSLPQLLGLPQPSVQSWLTARNAGAESIKLYGLRSATLKPSQLNVAARRDRGVKTLEAAMLGAAGVFGVMAGMISACLPRWLPAYAEAVQTAAGLMLLGGFALMGSAMPVML